jgi:hypothetical protein
MGTGLTCLRIEFLMEFYYGFVVPVRRDRIRTNIFRGKVGTQNLLLELAKKGLSVVWPCKRNLTENLSVAGSSR